MRDDRLPETADVRLGVVAQVEGTIETITEALQLLARGSVAPH